MGEYNPIESEYVYQYCKSIDKELLDIFINQFKGIHNYRSFTSDKDNGNYERDIFNKMDRTSLGRCASAVGLYLNKIEY